MAWSEPELERRARRAYETGRWQRALAGAWPAAPLAALSAAACGVGTSPVVGGLFLAGALVGLRWRGGTWAEAVAPGLWAGALAFVPALFARSATICPAGPWSVCAALCLSGGLAAGIAIAVQAHRRVHERRRFLVVATFVAGLTGGLGCAAAGLVALLVMAIGIAMGSTPLLVALPARR